MATCNQQKNKQRSTMIISSAIFIKSAEKPSHFPGEQLPEIAFGGRSNVGKSSLINALVNRKRLVKTSSTPGRTQLLNFFLINNQFNFVDFPGYGYAKVQFDVQKKWGPMIEIYLKTRKNLKGVVVILDIRRLPDDKDGNFIKLLDNFNIPFILSLTKADKISKTKQKSQAIAIVEKLPLYKKEPVIFSAKTRQGLDDLKGAIASLLDPNINILSF